MVIEIDLIKALKEIRGPDGTPAFQETDEEAVTLLVQAGLQPHLESDAFVNTGWRLRLKLMNTPEWREFSLAMVLMAIAEDQDPELETKRRWLKVNTTLEDGITAIQLFSQAAKRQKADGGF